MPTMPCSTWIRRTEQAWRWAARNPSYPDRGVLAKFAVRRRHRLTGGLGPRVPVADVGQDLHRRTGGEQLDQPRPVGRGDVGATPGPTAEQQVAVGVGDHHRFDRVLPALAGGGHVAARPPGRRSADLTWAASMIAVCPLAPRCSTTSAGVRNRIPGSMLQPRPAGNGRTSAMARVMVERLTPNQQPSTSSATPWRRWISVGRVAPAQRPVQAFELLAWSIGDTQVPATAACP